MQDKDIEGRTLLSIQYISRLIDVVAVVVVVVGLLKCTVHAAWHIMIAVATMQLLVDKIDIYVVSKSAMYDACGNNRPF